MTFCTADDTHLVICNPFPDLLHSSLEETISAQNCPNQRHLYPQGLNLPAMQAADTKKLATLTQLPAS